MVRWDLEDADLDDGKIVCKQGADIILYDIAADKSEKLDINLTSDFDQRRIQWIKDPKSKITSLDLSYKGDHVVITSRGRIFSVPVGGGRWSEVTRKYGIRYKNATYLNPENEIVMLSDESGEFEIWKTDNYGFNAPLMITSGSKNFIENYYPSPDGSFIVYNEKDNRVMLFSKKSGTSKLIVKNDFGFQGPFSWSPDSRWIAYTDVADNQNGYIKLYNVKSDSSYQVSTERLENRTPRFSKDAKWLYFISDRTFVTSVKSPWGSRQPEPYYEKTAKLYAVALTASADFPFLDANELNPLKADTTKTEAAKADEKKTDKPKKKADKVEVDLTDLSARLYVVPMKAANIGDFVLNDDWLYWSEYNAADNSVNLNALKISNKKNNELVNIAAGIIYFTISGDGKKLLIRDKNGIVVLNADGTKPDTKKDAIDLTKWIFAIDPVEDWKQMFKDAWRMERDYFYDRNMHGVDWQEIYINTSH